MKLHRILLLSVMFLTSCSVILEQRQKPTKSEFMIDKSTLKLGTDQVAPIYFGPNGEVRSLWYERGIPFPQNYLNLAPFEQMPIQKPPVPKTKLEKPKNNPPQKPQPKDESGESSLKVLV